jgi:uncharacterized membrane protein
MKKYIAPLLALLVISSCSTPKYTYHFDYYDYNSGKKKAQSQPVTVSVERPAMESTIVIDEETLVASAKDHEVYVAKPAPVVSKEEAVAKLNSLSREEKKELKKEVKRYVKENKKAIKEGKAPTALENDVKLAAIFGAVGIVLLIIGGEVLYILGAVALLIGLYFLIRYLARQ